MILEKFRWIWKLLWSTAYMVATDRGAVVYIPYVDPYMIGNITMLTSQRIAIENMVEQLNDVLKEHDNQLERIKNEFKEK